LTLLYLHCLFIYLMWLWNKYTLLYLFIYKANNMVENVKKQLMIFRTRGKTINLNDLSAVFDSHNINVANPDHH
jgi:hypothetical protein